MEDFYKYLQVNQDHTLGDLVVINAGHTCIPAESSYPPIHHPSHHYFNFSQGRVIDEYQFVFISGGKGILETRRGGKQVIEAGEGFILFPGEWHRYKPDPGTGWTESWVGFRGYNSFMKDSALPVVPSRPVFRIGLDDRVMNLLHQIFELVKSDHVGSGYALSGAVMYLLGHIFTLLRRQELKINNRTDEIIMAAKSIMESGYADKISLEDIANQLSVSYAWFRRYFKTNTGYSPYEYVLNIRIRHARMLLQNSGRSVKEISLDTGFESQQQFSRTFKKKTGYTPVQFRNYSKVDFH